MPASIGWRWVIEGFRLLRRQPLALLAMTFMFLMLLILSTLVPALGGVMPLLLTPLLSFGLMGAFRMVDRGQLPRPGQLLAGVREARGMACKPLLLLGVFNALATVAALTLTTAIDGGTLMRVVTGTIEPGDPGLRDGALAAAALLFALAYTPIQMALWYAPLFVSWHGLGLAQSLFFSLVAVWRNRGAFLALALGWVAVAGAVSLAVQPLGGLLGASPVLASFVLSPLSLAMVTALYGSIWASYRDPIRDENVAPGLR